MTEMDRIDAELLQLLQNDARIPNKALAARVGLAPSSALERVRRLVANGVLRGFHGEVDPKQVGIGLQAMISVRLTRHSRQVVEDFRRYVLTVPEVIAVFHTAGRTDFMIHVAVRDAEHLREVGLSAFTTRKEVSHLETALIFEHQRKATVPLYIALAEKSGIRSRKD